MKIAILSNLTQSNGSRQHPFFPLFKWKRQLSAHGLSFDFFNLHLDTRIFNFQTILINHRYFQTKIIKGEIKERREIIEFVIKLRQNGCKIIWYDTADSTGSNDFDIISYVDLFLKKQLLKDTNHYTQDRGLNSVRIWTSGESNTRHIQYNPCPEEELHKLDIGWNIGLCDYRLIPARLGLLTNRLIWTPKINPPSEDRLFDLSFRGTLELKSDLYSTQRNLLISFLQGIDKTKYKILRGDFVNRIQFMKELYQTRIAISPFGWGEICHRDFEAFISGALLIKPNMDHLRFFPNFFQNNETYLSTNWDFSNIAEILESVVENYSEYLYIAENAQQKFELAHNDFDGFYRHLQSILRRIN